jgi:hypothetical protein
MSSSRTSEEDRGEVDDKEFLRIANNLLLINEWIKIMTRSAWKTPFYTMRDDAWIRNAKIVITNLMLFYGRIYGWINDHSPMRNRRLSEKYHRFFWKLDDRMLYDYLDTFRRLGFNDSSETPFEDLASSKENYMRKFGISAYQARELEDLKNTGKKLPVPILPNVIETEMENIGGKFTKNKSPSSPSIEETIGRMEKNYIELRKGVEKIRNPKIFSKLPERDRVNLMKARKIVFLAMKEVDGFFLVKRNVDYRQLEIVEDVDRSMMQIWLILRYNIGIDVTRIANPKKNEKKIDNEEQENFWKRVDDYGGSGGDDIFKLGNEMSPYDRPLEKIISTMEENYIALKKGIAEIRDEDKFKKVLSNLRDDEVTLKKMRMKILDLMKEVDDFFSTTMDSHSNEMFVHMDQIMLDLAELLMEFFAISVPKKSFR